MDYCKKHNFLEIATQKVHLKFSNQFLIVIRKSLKTIKILIFDNSFFFLKTSIKCGFQIVFSLFNNSITISLSFISEMPKHFFPASFIEAPI